MKQNTLQHNYLNAIIQNVLDEMQWIKVKLIKAVRSLHRRKHKLDLKVEYSTISYKQEYLLTTIQERILR